ncbi:thioredoxin family protein [Sporomusa malonica]|uniref:Small redox-active disulfide protein 2 n=1 Tax=Sporomusa malonica TaxID=112901 RepID=A0A1W1YGE6_9FIRM|nr:thioredoxin family protein [Sporomusa malonica]SMC34881.1 small redox-active disulfide protein 2 [Sporomusa malonica]
MKIEVLGMGCAKCHTLTGLAMEAVAELGITAEIVKVDNMKDIMAYGVMTTPALVIDGVVKVKGKIPSKDEIKAFIKG